MKIEIKNRSLEVIFSHDCEDNSLAITVEAAIAEETNLEGANLEGANLECAWLCYADLEGIMS